MVKIPFLATPDIAIPAVADKRFIRAGAQAERRRVYIGIEADRVALTKTIPPNGVYFHDLQTGEFWQWVSDHWENIGQTFLGDLALSEVPEYLRPSPTPYSYGAGGSVVAVGGPPGSGNPINQPVGIGQPTITVLTGANNAPAVIPIVGNDPPIVVYTFDPLPDPAPRAGSQNLMMTVYWSFPLAAANTQIIATLGVNGVDTGIPVYSSLEADSPYTDLGFSVLVGINTNIVLEQGDILSLFVEYHDNAVGNTNITITAQDSTKTIANLYGIP